MRHRFDDFAASEDAALDAATDLSMNRFNEAHRRIGKTAFAAVALFVCGSVRPRARHDCVRARGLARCPR
jgi:hypothetical protein